MIDHVGSFMKGDSTKVEEYVESKMITASKKMLYEEAALHSDQLNAVRGFSSRKSQTGESYENRDVFALAAKDEMGIMVILRIRNGFIYSQEKLSLRNLFGSDSDTFKSVITRFYMGSNLIPSHLSFPLNPRMKRI